MNHRLNGKITIRLHEAAKVLGIPAHAILNAYRYKHPERTQTWTTSTRVTLRSLRFILDDVELG